MDKLNEFEILFDYDIGNFKQFIRDVLEYIPEDFDIASAFIKQIELDEKRDAEFHKHPQGQDGASQLGSCVYLKAFKQSGLKIPRSIGLKADMGAAIVGKFWHDKIIQPTVKRYFDETFNSDLDVEYGVEIYVRKELYEGYWIQSPIDVMFTRAAPDKPAYIKATFSFKNIDAELPTLHPDAIPIMIFDIKSSSHQFGFKHHKLGCGQVYKAQGHFYMFATGLREIWFMFVDKNNGHCYFVLLKWDQAFWDEIIDRNKRAHSLAKVLKLTGGNALILPEDLAFIYDPQDNFQCKWVCPLSKTHDERTEKGDIELVFETPCEPAVRIIEQQARERFSVGQMWKRGSSHITIREMTQDKIYSRNKGGKEFTDTLFNAWKTFKVLEEKPKKDSQRRLTL